MATFYSVWGPTNTAYRCYISESRTQNITNNTSTVSVTAYFQTQWGYPIEDANTHVRAKVRGHNVIDKTYNLSVGVNTSKNIGSGSRTLTHNADGTLSDSGVELLVNTRNTGLFNNTASGSISHPTIPRATTPTSGNFTTGTATSISLPRASDAFTHEVTYKVGTATGTISSSAGTTASWTPAHSLGSQFPNATSATVTITVKTKNGSTEIGTKTMSKTLSLASSRVPPVSSVTFADQNTTAAANIGAYVQGKSHLKATIAGSGIDGSTIPSGNDKRRVTINGTTYNQGANIPLPSSGSHSYTGRITDSRGREGTSTGSINVLTYTEPRFVTVRAYRSATASGAETNDGKYIRIRLQTQVQSLVVGTQKNWHSIQVRTRPTGGAWSNRNTVANAALAYDGTINVSGGAIFSDITSYDVEITIVDRVGTAVQYTDRVSTAVPALDMRGTNVGIAKMHEQGALDVGPGGIYDNGSRVLNRSDIEMLNITTQNLNTFTTPGYRFQTGTANATSARNYPPGGLEAGALEVIPNSVGDFLIQRYTTYQSKREFVRTLYTYGGGWQAWREIGAAPAIANQSITGVVRGATQAQVDAGTVTSEYYVSPGTLRNRNYAPWAMAQGQVSFTLPSGGGVASATVTFPSGRFNRAPIVHVTLRTGAAKDVIANPHPGDSITSTSATIAVQRSNNTPTVVSWLAIQMTSGNSSG